ncbi:MAG: conserved membrane protein of unknown function [Promethearchaeota archaeon]|nr:MAG: conserved membrane protein of unknown function [Candidatus Lokiarchaeota archaeon]
MVEYETIEIVNGSLSLLFLIISWIVSIKISRKYFVLKDPTFLYMGVSWIGVTSPWWGSTISFIVYLISERGIPLQFYLLITITFVPIFMVLFLKAITDLIGKEYQRTILIIILIEGFIFEIFYLYYIFINPQVLGVLESETDIRFKGFVMIYLISVVLILLISGIIFGKISLQSKSRGVQIQGKFLIAAFVSFSIGSFLDSSIPLNLITLPISRLILISSSIEFYLGFGFPHLLQRFMKIERAV